MALTPGGSRSSTKPRPSPPPPDRPRPRRGGRRPVWSRGATISVLRLGVLLGGLVIIADLSTQAVTQRTLSTDDVSLIQTVDELANYVLFSMLGILVVRDTGLLYAGAVAGVFASILDAIVVAAALLLAPTPTPVAVIEQGIAYNLAIGTVFAGISGLVYALVQRWSGGRRTR